MQPDAETVLAWRPVAAAAAAVIVPIASSYLTDCFAASTSERMADPGGNSASVDSSRRSAAVHSTAWQAALAVAGAGSWLAMRGPATLPPISTSFFALGSPAKLAPSSWLHSSLSMWLMLLPAAILVLLALRRSEAARLVTSVAGLLAGVEAMHMRYSQLAPVDGGLSATSLTWAAACLIAVAVLHSSFAPQVSGPKSRQDHAHQLGYVPPKPLQRTTTPSLQAFSQCLSPCLFGGGATPVGSNDCDTGHFIVQPTGTFTHVRSPVASLLARVSTLLGGVPAAQQPPPRPWLDDVHRSIDERFYADPGPLGLKVRGPNYLDDKRKIEADSVEMELLAVDLLDVAPKFHIARHLPSVLQSKAPFMFVMQVMVPGKPTLSLTTTWAVPYDPMGPSAPSTPFVSAMRAFLEADDVERSNMFKLIPRVEKGSWMVKQAVGQNTPVLLGKKLTTRYFRGHNYMEVDVDVGSSSTASSVVGLVAGGVKGFVIDMAVLMQANCSEHLPESLLGTMRLVHLELSAAPWLDTDANVIVPKDQPPPPCVSAAAAAASSPAVKTGWLHRRVQSSGNIASLHGTSRADSLRNTSTSSSDSKT